MKWRFQTVILVTFYFTTSKKVKTQCKLGKKLYDVYGEKSLTERQCQNGFARFRSGDFHLKDAPRSGRPTEIDDDKIKAEKLNISHTCVERHLTLRYPP